MNIQITVFLIAILGNVHAEPSSVERDPTTLASDWARLAARIKAVLPGDWVLETSPFQAESVAYQRSMGSDDPMIIIYKPISIHALPENGVGFVVRKEPFLVQYRLEPKISEKRWQDIADENIRADRLVKGYEQQLVDCAQRQKKDDGPSYYAPTNEQQKTLLREYYFVWNYTRSVELPDYWFGSLAVYSKTNEGYSFREKDVEAEYAQVVKKVSTLMTAYGPSKEKSR
jgi:hypothetical protein